MLDKESIVVYVNKNESYLIYGTYYKIMGITYDSVEGSYYYRLYDDTRCGLYPIDYFTTPIEFRKEKINKIKQKMYDKKIYNEVNKTVYYV